MMPTRPGYPMRRQDVNRAIDDPTQDEEPEDDGIQSRGRHRRDKPIVISRRQVAHRTPRTMGAYPSVNKRTRTFAARRT